MEPKKVKKISEIEHTLEIREPKQDKTETKEKLSSKEREHLREEVLEEIIETEKPAKKAPAPKSDKTVPKAQPTDKSPTLLRIEGILQEDLEDVYFKMDPETQEKFKTEGEKAAAQIEEILKQAKVRVEKIFKLILNWLKVIPSINKFFIKQEAKIKTDRIIKINKN